MNFFKRLFSSSNLELQINDGGRYAAGYKGKVGDCVVRSIAIVSCSKHITVVKNGILHDTYDCSRSVTRCVYGYWTKSN